MKVVLEGYNDFYEGWLCGLFSEPFDGNPLAREGFQMAKETGVSLAITALIPEIKKGHIKVSIDNTP